MRILLVLALACRPALAAMIEGPTPATPAPLPISPIAQPIAPQNLDASQLPQTPLTAALPAAQNVQAEMAEQLPRMQGEAARESVAAVFEGAPKRSRLKTAALVTVAAVG